MLSLTVSAKIVMFISKFGFFRKAGRPLWNVLVPFYSDYVFSEMIYGGKLYFVSSVILNLIGIAGVFAWSQTLLPLYMQGEVILFVAAVGGLANVYNKSSGYTLGMVIMPPIFWLLLAFDKSPYTKPTPSDKRGFLHKLKKHFT